MVQPGPGRHFGHEKNVVLADALKEAVQRVDRTVGARAQPHGLHSPGAENLELELPGLHVEHTDLARAVHRNQQVFCRQWLDEDLA